MVMPWGLEYGNSIENVLWVVRSNLDDEWLVGLDSVLEWVTPSAGFDVSECFIDQRMVDLHELIPFMRWLAGYNRDEHRAKVVILWDSLKILMRQRMVVGGRVVIPMVNVGGGNANGRRGRYCGRRARGH